MPGTAESLALPDPIVEWIEDVTAAKVERVDRRPGGARKEAWFVDVRGDDGADELFLRYDRSDPEARGDPWTLRRESIVYLALQATEVPVPRVLAVHPTEQAMLTERVVGDNWFSRIRDPATQLRVARDFMTHLAALHRLDPRRLDLPGFPTDLTVAQLVHHELDEWERVIEFRGGDPDPGLRLSLDWLRSNVPDYDGPPVLVQGDTGPGNFMYGDGRVLAVVDWELAHLGDPMDDIAWLSLRAVQEPFTHLPDRLAEYEQLTGNTIDETRVHYYQVMAETKLLVMSHAPGQMRLRRTRRGRRRRREQLDLRRAAPSVVARGAVALRRTSSRRTPRSRPSARPTEADYLFADVLAQLRDTIVPRVSDPLALQRTKGVARILKYLAAIQRDGGVLRGTRARRRHRGARRAPRVGRSRAARDGRRGARRHARARRLPSVPLEAGRARERAAAARVRRDGGPALAAPALTEHCVSTTTPGREYPTFGPEDDDFHDGVMSDRWWETETCWFSWNVPERKLGGWTYCQARPNARLCNGGVWVWDDSAAFDWELPYHVNYSGLQLPDRARHARLRMAQRCHDAMPRAVARYEITYADPPDLELSIVFDAIMAPNPHPVGVAPFLAGRTSTRPGT